MPGGKVLKVFEYTPSAELIVRPARVGDAEEITALTLAAYSLRVKADPPYAALSEGPEHVREHLSLGGGIVAEAGGRVAGCIRWRVESPGILLGYRLAVSPDFQRRGIGSRLLARLEGVAQREECRQVHLHVRRNSPELMDMYARFGYSIIIDNPEPEYNHPIYVVMMKRIVSGP